MADQLNPGGQLKPGEFLLSRNGQYKFAVQDDGNVVIYREADGSPLWSSETYGTWPEVLEMQHDGNLVLYGSRPPRFGPGAREALWASGTDGRAGAWFVMQDDGNAVVYSLEPQWASGTWQG